MVTSHLHRSALCLSWSSSQPVDQPQCFLEKFSRHRDFGHLEDGVAGVARTTLAPISISFSRRLVSVPCATASGRFTLLSAVDCLLAFRVRRRVTLELELVALRHQLTVLRRQRPGRPRPRAKKGHPLRCQPESHSGLASAPDHRGLPLGNRPSLSAARPRRFIWAHLLRSCRGDGSRAGRHRAAIAVAERLCRAHHRLDPPRMSRSHLRLR